MWKVGTDLSLQFLRDFFVDLSPVGAVRCRSAPFSDTGIPDWNLRQQIGAGEVWCHLRAHPTHNYMEAFEKLAGGNRAIRIDRWLVAARLYKTRGLAQDACAGGHVKVNDQSVKASHLVKCGDEVKAESPRGSLIVVVRHLAEKRLSAPLARELYEDHSPPPPPKEERLEVATRERGTGRPTKADRRALQRLRGDET